VVVPLTRAICCACAEYPKVSVIIEAQIRWKKVDHVQHNWYSNLIHIEHSAQSKCRIGEILLHADKILHLLAKEITGYSFGHKCQLPMYPYAY
jgi:hypothetical protein